MLHGRISIHLAVCREKIEKLIPLELADQTISEASKVKVKALLIQMKQVESDISNSEVS